jgi:hypothetical protein
MREYYKVHPEHLPPPEVRKWLRRPLSLLTPVEEARRGNPDHLIAHLRSGGVPGPVEIEFFIELLESVRGKQQRDRLHRIELLLIAVQVQDRTKTMGKQESAIAEVMKQRHCSRRKVFEALQAYRDGLLGVI